jgi:AraC-like DNA-binding protein
MVHLNFVNLIQAGIISTGILGGILLLLTRNKEFKGVSALLFCIALSSSINILEEAGVTRDIYLISPVFIMFFGPLTFLAFKLLIDKKLTKNQWWHLAPVIPFLLLTPYPQVVIGIGTLWRLVYAALTVAMLLKYKKSLDEERSDSDDFSLNWLIWVLALTAAFNIIDLVRLNTQHMITYDLNVLGQGINNAVWLIVSMVVVIKLQKQSPPPKNNNIATPETETENQNTIENYRSLFEELDNLIITNQWFLKPRLTLNDVSDLTGLQTRDISRAINVVKEKSFNEYVNAYRVNFVCSTMKKNSKKSLSDISADAGFSSKASFNKVFKQVTGATPSEYRAQSQV